MKAIKSQKTILFVEDDEMLRSTVKEFLEKKGFIVVTAEKISDSKSKAQNQKFDLIIMDYQLKNDETSDKLLNYLKDKTSLNNFNEHTPIIVLSGTLDSYSVRQFASHTKNFLIKPVDNQTLLFKIYDVLGEVAA